MTETEAELNVLAFNSGSSSLKFGLYRVGVSQLEVLLTGKAEAVDNATGWFEARNSRNDSLLSEALSSSSQRDAPTRSFHWINALAVLGLIIVGVLLLNDDALGQDRELHWLLLL